MKRASLLLIASILFFGCSQKQYYNPDTTKSASVTKSSNYIKFFSRDGATLDNGVALSPKNRFDLNLKDGQFFINRTPYGVIVATKGRDVTILRGKLELNITLPKPLIAGTIIKNKLIYVLKDNSFGVYNLDSKSIEFNDKSQVVNSIDTRVANPILVDNIVVIPLLNGKLIIFDARANRYVKEILVGANSILNNIIFLKKIGDTLVVSTPHKVVTISNRGKQELEEEVSEVAINGQDIFIFLKDGRVLRADAMLRVQDEKKFKFAHFVVGAIYKNRVYALEKQGYLIVTNRNFTKTDVYKLPEVEAHSFVSGKLVYYDNNIINLDKI
jgi:hypothetical protein